MCNICMDTSFYSKKMRFEKKQIVRAWGQTSKQQYLNVLDWEKEIVVNTSDHGSKIQPKPTQIA